MGPITWFKVDDGLPTNRKLLSIPRRDRMAAMGLWCVAGAWVARELHDGFVPRYVLTELGATIRQAQLLVQAGFWIAGDGGWWFKDWDEWQPTRDDVLSKRRKNAEKLAKWRARNQGTDEFVTGLVTGVQDGSLPVTNQVSNPAPDPTRPVPIKTPVVAAVVEPDPVGDREPAAAGPAEQLVGEWTRWLGDAKRPPTKVVTAIGKQVAELLADGIPYRDVKRGLIQWQTRGNLGPAVLPSIVHEVRTKPAAVTADRRQQATDHTFDQAFTWAAEQEQKAIGT